MSSTGVGRKSTSPKSGPGQPGQDRQRGDSNRPVGNNKGVNTSARARVGYHGQEVYQAAKVAAGNEPGRVSSA